MSLSTTRGFAIERALKALMACSLALCVALYFFWSRHWPLVGDASLIHYICFLMDRGMAPYRDLGDMNMPGAYIVEWTVMHTLGGGAAAWRVFDFGLMAIAVAAIFSITRPYDWFAGWFAGGLFILAHGRDGLGQGGQRDLTMAICLLVSIAFLFEGVRKNRAWSMAAFGLCAGMAATIKPTILPFGAVLLVLAMITLRRRGVRVRGHAIGASAAFFCGPLVALIFLWHKGAVRAFLEGLSGIVPYYASLGHRPLVFLLQHSISPLLPLVVIWVVLLAVQRPRLTWERAALFLGVGFGLASYVIQARGFPYYRYPLLVFLLPLVAIDFCEALRTFAGKAGLVSRGLGIAGEVVGALIIATMSAGLISRYETHADFVTSLEEHLEALGGQALSGHVQCVDSISGCGTTLYKMRLVQSTGVLSDFLLFGPETAPVVRATREEFRKGMVSAPPQVIVVSGWLHIDGPGDYEKLARWPEFAGFLSVNYELAKEWRPSRPDHWWSRRVWPDGYRVYVLKRSNVKWPSVVR